MLEDSNAANNLQIKEAKNEVENELKVQLESSIRISRDCRIDEMKENGTVA